jgi:alpha-1,2-mannosyltransferase
MPDGGRSGGLDQRSFAWIAVLLAVETMVFAFIVVGTHGLLVELPKPLTTDFVSFYAAGELAWRHTATLAYDMAAHYQAEQAVTAPGIGYQFFFYPPVWLLPLAPLSRLPYLVAFVLFQATTLAAFLGAVRLVLPGAGWRTLIVVLAFPAVWWTFGQGQNSFLTAAFFTAGLALLWRRPVLAGVLLGCLCYKPHIGLLIPVALVAGRHWRAFAAAAVTVAVVVLLSIAVFGIAPWEAFISRATGSSGIYADGHINLAGMVTPFALARLAHAPSSVASAIQAVMALLAAVFVWHAWRRPAVKPEAQAAALLAATLLAAPILLLYDYVLAEAALVFLFAANGRRVPSGITAAIVLAVAAVPLVCLPLATVTPLQIGPLASLALVWLTRPGQYARA